MTAAGTVFVVDDEAPVRKGLDRLLRAAGFQVAQFSSAQDFLGTIGEAGPGCVILDYHMPGLNGLELLEVLASRGARWPIVFLTGHGDIPAADRAKLGAAVDFLLKPAGQEELLAAVERALARDAQQRAEMVRRGEKAEIAPS